VRRLLGALVVAMLVAGCVGSSEPAAPADPQPCGQVFNAVRCLVMTDSAATQLKTTREDITVLEVIPEPTPDVRDGETILTTRSGGPPIDVRVTRADGSTQVISMNCGGVAPMSNPACQDDPHVSTSSMLDGGYYDTLAESSPVPSLSPDALAEATTLRVDRLDVPIDHVGPYEVHVGELDVPNGVLTSVDFSLVDDWPPGVTILEGIRLDIRTLDGEPIENIYEHGWRDGTERVVAVLVFDVAHHDAGAVLSVRDVVVR
jgi:hypothetical protein